MRFLKIKAGLREGTRAAPVLGRRKDRQRVMFGKFQPTYPSVGCSARDGLTPTGFRRRMAALWLGLICLATGRLPACGPDFPNHLLDRGDEAVLQAPVASFERELERMKVVTPRLHAVPPADGQTLNDQSTAVEMTDLAAALKREKVASELATAILQAHLAERMKLNAFLARQDKWKDFHSGYWDTNGYHELPNTNPPPVFPDVAVTPGLPREFADYFAGAIAWHQGAEGEEWAAREDWERVLELPAAERHFKSTGAAYMLAQCDARHQNPQDTDDEALKYFEQVRTLAKDGFGDSAGLATASLGGEALIYLNRKNFERALELYQEQFAAGDGTALNSLQFTAARTLAATNATAASLKTLALNPRSRRVLTAYLISRNPYNNPPAANDPPSFDRTTAWLNAVEAAGVEDLDSAEVLALAAYQTGQWDSAQRWINRAPASPVAQWLQAKLLLRAGKVNEAGALLAKLSRQFPMEPADTRTPASFPNSLSVTVNEYWNENIPIGRQALGELGALHLVRREYLEALDALLRAGFWEDAAYVAERVLTVEELKKYVDRNWPAVAPKPGELLVNRTTGSAPEMTVRESIRYLLARRLARAEDGRSVPVPGTARSAGGVFLASSNQLTQAAVAAPGDPPSLKLWRAGGRTPMPNPAAREYYPTNWQAQWETLRQAMQTGRDAARPAARRAAALVSAAYIMRTNGMELFGTEGEPDWHVHGGEYEEGVSPDSRTNGNPRLLAPSADELRRAAEHDLEPDVRFHYRFQAADLAVEAASLMPDNTAETAQVLCMAGTWIKNRDVVRADVIYKLLVRRCRETEIGSQADARRWFPVLDRAGHPIPYQPRNAPAVIQPRFDFIRMFDRQQGWAQNAPADFPTNDWRHVNSPILRTTNGGLSWETVLRANANEQVTAFFLDTTTAWAVSVYDGETNVTVLQTRHGCPWEHGEVSQAGSIQNVSLSFSDQDTGWLMLIPDHGMSTMPGMLYDTRDGGAYGVDDWRLVNRTGDWPNAEDNRASIEFAAPHPCLPCGGAVVWRDPTNGWLRGHFETTSPYFLFRTGDAGRNWQVQTLPPPAGSPAGRMEPDRLPQFFPGDGLTGILGAEFHPDDVDATNHYKVIYATHDGGVNWRPTTPVKDGSAWNFITDQQGWMWSEEPHDLRATMPGKGVLNYTEDGGLTWRPVPTDHGLATRLTPREDVVQLDFVDSDCGWALVREGNGRATRLPQTTDGGRTWREPPRKMQP